MGHYLREDPIKRKARQNKFFKKKRAARLVYAIEYLGGKCAICGNSGPFEFDHIPERGKKYLCVTMLLTRKIEILTAELDKCQLLCVQCHLDITIHRAEVRYDDTEDPPF